MQELKNFFSVEFIAGELGCVRSPEFSVYKACDINQVAKRIFEKYKDCDSYYEGNKNDGSIELNFNFSSCFYRYVIKPITYEDCL